MNRNLCVAGRMERPSIFAGTGARVRQDWNDIVHRMYRSMCVMGLERVGILRVQDVVCDTTQNGFVCWICRSLCRSVVRCVAGWRCRCRCQYPHSEVWTSNTYTASCFELHNTPSAPFPSHLHYEYGSPAFTLLQIDTPHDGRYNHNHNTDN
jgi:hypothetical protein